jgi:DNA topoisomerase-1
MGRFGPFVQIGTKDDEDKPRFAGLRPGQKMDLITLAEALELFKLPRTLGATAEGAPILANVGRFGPYIKYGAKYVSMKDDDPYTVTLERALELIRLKQEADANRIIADFADAGIQVLNGRYGPYITDGKKNAKVPQGPRAQVAHARGMPQAARGGSGPRQPLRPRQARRRTPRRSPRAAAAAEGSAARHRRAASAHARGRAAGRCGAPASARPAAARPAGARTTRRGTRQRARRPQGPPPSLKTKSPTRVPKAAAKRARVK